MDVHDFRKDFLEEIKTTAATEGEGSSAAFVSVATNYLVNSEVLADFIPAFYLGNGKNNRKIRVDGYVLDDFDLTFNLIVADYNGDISKDLLTRKNAIVQFERLIYFIEESFDTKLIKNIEPSTPAADLVDMLRVYKGKVRKYRLILLTDGFMSSRIGEFESRQVEGTPVEFQIWDVERIYKVCFSESGKQDIEINFKTFSDGQGIPCLEASNANSEDYKSYLCIIPGETLANIYDHFGSQLLEGNVRSFLSTKVAVNKKIRETILRIPQNFFAYNNGVSATAMDLQFETNKNGKFIVRAKDFQIINGGQTTASLSNAKRKDKDNADLSQIYVQMKLTEIDSNSDKASDLIRNISRSSNNQNKVSDADFFATHPFHVRMEQISRRLFAPATGGAQYDTKWFYERARGQYLQEQTRMTKLQKNKFLAQNPKKQLVTKTDLAKYRNSWSGLPQVVSKGAQTNFMNFAENIDEIWTKSDTVFNDKYFKDSIALAILFKHTEWIVSHQPWFEQGYRANIVTYSIALLHFLIKSQFIGMNLDLQLIWNKQQIPDVLTNELIKITKYVFDSITDPTRETINVTQWCKRDACFERIKLCPLKISNDLEQILVNKGITKVAEKEAKKDQKFISDIGAQKQVLEFGAVFWEKLYKFVINKHFIMTAEQATSIKYAMCIPIKFPSAYQSVQLLALLEKARTDGFKE